MKYFLIFGDLSFDLERRLFLCLYNLSLDRERDFDRSLDRERVR